MSDKVNWDDFTPVEGAAQTSQAPVDWSQFEEVKPSGAIRKMADKALGFAGGAVGATKALADAAGAGNTVSNALDSANNTVNDYLSPEEKASQQARSARTEQAKGTGAWNEFKTGVQNFAESPIQQTVTGVGSVVPVAIAALGGLPAAAATGIGMGVGTVKGRIYDDTKKRGIDAGLSASDAEAQATKAQDYTGENTDQIALGGALGAADALTGVGRIAGGALRNAVMKPAVSALPKAVERGIVGRAAMGALGEVPLESVQGGQEQLATNIAAQRQGANVDTWSGVAGQATEEGLASLGSGAGFGVAHSGSKAPQPTNTPGTPPAVPPVQPGQTPQDPAQLGYNPAAGTHTVFPDGSVVLNSESSNGAQTVRDMQRANRLENIGTDQEVTDVTAKPSEQMGLTPTAGPSLTNAAITAVDTGVHQQHLDQQTSEADQAAYDQYIAQQDEDARQQDTADKPLTHGALAEAAMSEDDKRAVLFSNKAVADGGTRYKGTRDGDILNGAGAPFTNYLSAGRRASMEGKDWTIAKIGEKQFVARRKDAIKETNSGTTDRVLPTPANGGGQDGNFSADGAVDRFDVTHAGTAALADPKNASVVSSYNQTQFAKNPDGSTRRVGRDHFESWANSGGVSSDVGSQYDGHGIAKGNPLGALLNILTNGINTSRRFDSAPLTPASSAAGAGSGLSSANGAYKDGPFILLGERGKSILDGIKTVLVSDEVAASIPALQQRFPDVRFVSHSNAQAVLSQDANVKNNQAPANGGNAETVALANTAMRKASQPVTDVQGKDVAGPAAPFAVSSDTNGQGRQSSSGAARSSSGKTLQGRQSSSGDARSSSGKTLVGSGKSQAGPLGNYATETANEQNAAPGTEAAPAAPQAAPTQAVGSPAASTGDVPGARSATVQANGVTNGVTPGNTPKQDASAANRAKLKAKNKPVSQPTSTEVAAPTGNNAPSVTRPNIVIRDVRGFNGEKLGDIIEPHDGTKAGILAAAERTNVRLQDEYPDATHAGSRTGATDENGAPKWAISPNGQNIAPFDTKEGAYIFGDLSAAPTPQEQSSVKTPKAIEASTPAQTSQAEVERTATEHAGVKIYPITFKGEPHWSVQSEDNRTNGKVLGDTIHATLEGAKQSAEEQVRRVKSKQERNAAYEAEQAAAQAKKDANKGKSLADRKRDFDLDKPTKLPVQAGLGTGTRRESMQKAVDQDRYIEAATVRDEAAKKRDTDLVERSHRANLPTGNINYPGVKEYFEAQARLKANKYEKPEYRVYMGRDGSDSFYEITKTEYDYAQELKAEPKDLRENYIKSAVDSIGRLRKSDVDRVLNGLAKDNIDGVTRADLAAYIKEKHPDYTQEVDDVLAEIATATKSPADLVAGDRFKDANGAEFQVWSARQGRIEAHPVVDGKPVVNRDSVQRWATTDAVHGANPEYRTDIVVQHAAVHQDPGKAPEAATAPVIAQSLAKAARKEDHTQKEMRLWLVGEIDKAVKLTEDYADYQESIKKNGQDIADSIFFGKHSSSVGLTTPQGNGTITFDVPGDGKFKIRNSLRGLMEFRAKVEAKSGTGFTDKPTKAKGLPASTGVAKGSSNQIEALSSMLEELDFEAAVDYARETGTSLDAVKISPEVRKQFETYLKDGTEPQQFSPSRYWEYPGQDGADKDGNPIRKATLTKQIGASEYVALVVGTNATGFKYNITKDGKAVHAMLTSNSFANALKLAEDAINAIQPEVVKPKDTGWNMRGVGYAGKRYVGRNITLDDGREVVARIYENAGLYEDAEVKVDGVSKFRKTDRYKAEKLADDFIRTLTAKEPAKAPIKVTPQVAGNTGMSSNADPNAITQNNEDANYIPKGWKKDGAYYEFRSASGSKFTPTQIAEVVGGTVTKQGMHSIIGVPVHGWETAKRRLKDAGMWIERSEVAQKEDSKNGETIPAVSEAQARKQFEWRNMGQKDGTKSHLLFFFESEKDKGTGAAMNRGEVSLYPGASGWKVEDGDGTSYKSLADAKKAAIDLAIPKLQDQGYILKPAQAATAILDAANVTGKERIDALKDVKKGDITPEELQAAYPAIEGVERAEPWKMTRAEAAESFPGDEYDKMLNRSAVLGDITYEEAGKRSRINVTGNKEFWAKTRKDLLQDKKDAVKFARGDRAEVNKLKPTEGFAAWRIKSMSATGKSAIEAAGKYHDELLAVHKERVQEALDEGKDVPPEVLADYPDLAKSSSAQPAAKSAIGDFGQKIGGAKKDTWTGFKDDLNSVKDDDIASRKLSEIWPAPDYQKMIDDGMDAKSVALIRSIRDEVPSKPRSDYKLRRWAEQVKEGRALALSILNEKNKGDTLYNELTRIGGKLSSIAGRADLYMAVGHEKSLEGIRLAHHHYSLYKGRENVSMWVAERDSAATAFSNFPQELATGDTKEQAIAAFKAKYDTLDATAAVKKAAFVIFTKGGGDKGFYIGKKIGRNIADMAGPFAALKEARAYQESNLAELEAKLEKYKEIPKERRDTNEPRVGEDMRNGQDVTPEMFAESFGFKGVEFGNYVEQKRRQKDLNDSFDALMDMAAIMGVPAKAISLNGELGLAFGARGSGGVNPAAAHYESDKIVINLTKREGAGSLGHEWWHALDNYFSRQRGGRTSPYMTTTTDVGLSSSGSNYVAYEGVRKEMIDAFGEVVKSIRLTAMKARSSKMDAKRTKEYWTTGEEMAARAFESYLISKLHDQNASNDYLANVVDQKTWDAMAALGMENEDSYPYPTAGEMPLIRTGFDKFFQTLETKETESGNVAMFSRPRFSRGAQSQANESVERLATGIASHWDNAPKIVVAFDMNDPAIHEDVRKEDQRQRSGGATGTPEGFYYKGTVYLMSSKLGTPNDIARVLFHEALGHYGLRGLFGKSLKPILNEISMRRRADVDAKIKQYGLKMGNKLDRFTAAEEVLAELAQTRPEIGIVQRAIAAIRTWLRENVPGFNSMRLSDNELIRNYILPARAFVELGAQGAVAERVEPVFSRSIGDTLNSAANSARDVSASTGIGRIANKAVDVLNDRLSYEGTVGIWHKTFGSMFQLAKSHPPFQKVFNAAQDFINDVAYYASEASDLAPKLLPKLEDWKDIGKQPISSADNQAIQAPIFEGTLSWARDESGKPVKMSDLEEAAAKLTTEQKAQRLLRGDHISENVLKMWQGLPIEQFEKNIESKYERDMLRPGVVWTPAELKSMFNLTGVKQANGAYDGQIGLYQEFRNAIDNSLDNTAKVDMLRYAGEPAADLREMILDAPDADTAAVLLRDHLLTVAEDDPGQSESLIEVANNIMEQADRVNKLKAEGYAPLSRFGQYSVDVVVDGKREYFDLFETKEAANQMAAKMRMEFGIGKVQTGTISAKEFQLFQGMTPESMELFGNMLGLDAGGENASDTVFQTYLRFTKNNRSAMKRLMHRKGIAGFSTDTGRVLASFIYSNARLTSSGLHMGTMDKAVQDIPKGQGQLKDAAIELREYIKNPREEAQAMRGLLFAQYLGGNVASMLMNFMQVPTVSLPYLSQFGGVKKATAALLQAMKDQKSDTLEKGLQQALKNADEKGITQPQALHELMAQSRGAATLKSGDGTKMGDAKALANNAMSKFSMGWGKLFGMAEQINRRSTFIAAYRLGIEKGVANPATFAENAVNETQFINNKANKAKFARGAIGGTLMTFKSYSTNYLELLYRLSTKNGPEGKKAALLMLGMLFLMAGAGGMPGAEDAEDLIDGIAQRMGYNLSTKKAKEKFLEEIFGKAIGSFILHGVSGLPGSPIDISGRAGFGNLIPGTGVFMPKASHANDLLEFGGPAAGMLKRFGEAVGHLSTGNVFEAAMAASPVAIANMRKGVDMLDSGMYKDAKGYKVMDTTTGEALAKIAGFQPKAVKDDSEDSYLRLRTKNFYNEYKQAVSARWANGLFENDADQVQEAKDMIASWNEKNPELPMRTNMFAIAQRLKHMKETRETRVLKSSPKVMQSTIRQEIAAEKAAQ